MNRWVVKFETEMDSESSGMGWKWVEFGLVGLALGVVPTKDCNNRVRVGEGLEASPSRAGMGR